MRVRQTMSTFTRRRLLHASLAAGAAVVAMPAEGAAAAGDQAPDGAPDKGSSRLPGGDRTWDLTVLGTSDLHGNVVNWDYYRDREYDDSAHNDVGLAKVAALIRQIRAERAGRATLVIDAGDTLQGTPLAYYYALREPITSTGTQHPMARAMNAIGYDATTLGNHEFNYGLPLLDAWAKQLTFPVLAANALDAATGRPAYQPYVIKRIDLGPGAPSLKVGILGLTNPGTAIWDRSHVEGTLTFADMVATAARWVPTLRRHGADLVLVSAHAGASGTSTYGGDLPIENAAALIAEQVPGIDAVLSGHTHVDIPVMWITNAVTGAQVPLSAPSKFGQRLTRLDFVLAHRRGRWSVTSTTSTTVNTNTVAEDPAVLDAVRPQHETTVSYVNQPVATSRTTLAAAQSRYRDTPIIDFITRIQAETVAAALAGTAYADLPLLSIAAPFSRSAIIPEGSVRIKDLAGLYLYDNTLVAVVLTGAEVRAYLEYSARYFVTLAPTDPVDPATISDPSIPDYNYDIVSGVDYQIDISRPIGTRITSLTYPGTTTAVLDTDQLVVAVNNYRQAGGGNFPGIRKTPIYNEQKEIRQLLIDWAQARGVLDPADFFTPNWTLVRQGLPVF